MTVLPCLLDGGWRGVSFAAAGAMIARLGQSPSQPRGDRLTRGKLGEWAALFSLGHDTPRGDVSKITSCALQQQLFMPGGAMGVWWGPEGEAMVGMGL